MNEHSTVVEVRVCITSKNQRCRSSDADLLRPDELVT